MQWVELKDFFKEHKIIQDCANKCIDYQNSKWIEFRNFIYQILKKEYEELNIPLIEYNLLNVDLNLTKWINAYNPEKEWIWLLIDENKIVGIVWMKETQDMLTYPFVIFPLTGLIDKKYIFELIYFTKEKIKEKIDEGYKYFSLTEKLVNGKLLAHNKRICKWFEKNFGDTIVAYQIVNGKIRSKK